MKQVKDAEKFAEEALSSIDDIQAVEVNGFIFTRIQNRRDIKKRALGSQRVIVMYGLSALLLLFIMINAASFYFLKPVKAVATAKQKTTGIAAFANDYNLEQSSYSY